MFPTDPDSNGVAIDFETADYGADSACAVGLVKIRQGKLCDSLYTLLRPPRARIIFTKIHGLTWKQLRDQPSFREFFPYLRAFLADTPLLIAHNAAFDRRVLIACCTATGCDIPPQPFCCTLKGARRGLHLLHNSLHDVCAQLHIPLRHHHALSDAQAAALIYLHLRRQGLSNAAMQLGAVHAATDTD